MPDIKKANAGSIQIVKRQELDGSTVKKTVNSEPAFQWIAPKKRRFSDRLFTNTLVATALLLCITVIRTANNNPDVQSVFRSIQENVSLNLDESLGKLSFVSNILPDAALVFWNDAASQSILSPIEGDIVHVWNAQEPYISMAGLQRDVRCAADGEVMSIAHGNGEEVIVRLRHPNGYETLYGNLESCFVAEGDAVYAGDLVGSVAADDEVYFELRQDGRSIDPTYVMKTE